MKNQKLLFENQKFIEVKRSFTQNQSISLPIGMSLGQ
jgi:hypothetical protein